MDLVKDFLTTQQPDPVEKNKSKLLWVHSTSATRHLTASELMHRTANQVSALGKGRFSACYGHIFNVNASKYEPTAFQPLPDHKSEAGYPANADEDNFTALILIELTEGLDERGVENWKDVLHAVLGRGTSRKARIMVLSRCGAMATLAKQKHGFEDEPDLLKEMIRSVAF